jgi:UDP-N-acetylmuramoyl-tripeptide--D-alanyl-D-alanine ligase
MSAAIENFSDLNHSNKMVILGDMLELGNESASEHSAIVNMLQHKNNMDAILVGPLFCEAGKTSNYKCFKNSEDALVYLKNVVIKNATILIKGSRGIKLEQVLTAL